MTIFSKKNFLSFTVLAFLYIGVLTVLRLWFCAQFDLIGDEAYYWLWSKHLDLSYFSKGPAVAWFIALGTRLAGDTVPGVRLPSVLLAAGTGVLMFRLARALFSEKIAFWSVILASMIPLFMIGGLLMTIDPISVFFWALAAWLFWKNKDAPSPLAWATTGLAVGLGMLGKYTNIAQLVCFGLFCWWSPSLRRKWPHFLVMTVVALLCLTPVLIWNMQHGWVTSHHLVHRGALDESWRFSASELFDFLWSQYIVFNPLFAIGLLWGFASMRAEQLKSDSYRYLFCLFFPLLVFFSALSLNKAGQANWAAPSWFAGVILLAALWTERVTNYKWAKPTAAVALSLSAIFFVAAHMMILVPVPNLIPSVKKDPLRRLRGAADIARQTAEAQDRLGASFLIANKYSQASLLAFYHPRRPTTYVVTHEGLQNQFSLWPGYSGHYPEGASAIYLSDSTEIPPQLKKEFASVELFRETFSMHQNRPLYKFYLFHCRGFHSMTR
ncbi:MAG: glycosyltransferase family 39 protein [bacterium]